jgi:tetratricopeptide (TPR) repeat protein
MDQSFLDNVLKATKDYWFLITLIASVLLTLAYMIVFRVNPWDQQRSAKLRRDRVRFHNSIGYALIETGHYEDARTEFEESLKLSAEDQTALNGKYLANLFIDLASPLSDPAIGFAIHEHLKETGALKHEEKHAHIIAKYLGDLHMRIADVPEALRFYSNALKLKKDYPDALYELGWYYYGNGQGDIAQMEEMFRKLTEVDPHGYRGFHGLGYALYMKALGEKDADVRTSLVREAAEQSGAAQNLFYSQLNVAMDFGEVARSVDPRLALTFHDYGKKLLNDPVLGVAGNNPSHLQARFLMSEGEIYIETKDEKVSWIAYQTALDHLAILRSTGDQEHAAEHKRLFEKAQRLDPDKKIQQIYVDQLAILDLLLPAVKDEVRT